MVVHLSDNASTDDTLKIVEAMADSRVIIHRSTETRSAEDNFSYCIQLACGKYTAIFHADDVYEADMVQRQVEFLEATPEAGAVFTGAAMIDEQGVPFGTISFPQRLVKKNQGMLDFSVGLKAVLEYGNFFVCPSFMVRSEIYLHEIVDWRGGLFKSSADLDVWLRILQHHMIGYLPESLMRYRISRDQHSSRLRTRTTRSDFFLVTDDYLARPEVRSMLNAADWAHYRCLQRSDRVLRAMNAYMCGDVEEARKLCSDMFDMEAIRFAVSSRRGLITMGAAVLIRFFIASGLSLIGRPLLYRLRTLTGK